MVLLCYPFAFAAVRLSLLLVLIRILRTILIGAVAIAHGALVPFGDCPAWYQRDLGRVDRTTPYSGSFIERANHVQESVSMTHGQGIAVLSACGRVSRRLRVLLRKQSG